MTSDGARVHQNTLNPNSNLTLNQERTILAGKSHILPSDNLAIVIGEKWKGHIRLQRQITIYEPLERQGMSPALSNNALPLPPTIITDKSREMAQAHKRDVAIPIADSDVSKTQKTHTQSFDYIWRSGVAGGLAGCAAKSVVAPLDRVKILFQAKNPQFAKYAGSWFGVATAMKDIYREDGTRGLFRGHSATLLRIFPYAAIKFLAYEQIRGVIIHDPQHETPLRRLVSGSLAGVTSVFFTYPLEVIRVRLAFETKSDSRSSLTSICKRIYNESRPSPTSATSAIATVTPNSGISNFYRGFSATVIGMIPYAGISFLTHDTAGDLLRHPSISKYTILPKRANSPTNKPPPLRSWAELLAGGIAGLVSQTSAYPLEVIRRRMQVGGAVGDGHRLRVAETAKQILREKGVTGFFVGLTIGYVKVVPMAAISFFVYERGKLLLGI